MKRKMSKQKEEQRFNMNGNDFGEFATNLKVSHHSVGFSFGGSKTKNCDFKMKCLSFRQIH